VIMISAPRRAIPTSSNKRNCLPNRHLVSAWSYFHPQHNLH
jgi:hypothetical protein